MINFALAREIYGMSPWFVDQETLPSLLSIVDNHASMELPEVKYNSPGIFVLNETRVIDRPYGNDWTPGQLDNKENFTGIGIIKLDGPITLSGGASTVGMEQLSLMMLKMAGDKRIVSFVVLSNSGGGSASAVEVMADTISKIDKIKPVYGLVKKGGIAASACYGIISACREIYAESPMSLVGSAGTMIQFEGRAANSEHEGVKYIRLYAKKSNKKNEEFEEALNNDNYELIIDNLLEPMNENFLKLILKNRPQLQTTNFDSGKTVFAKEGIGTYIDGIKTFAEVVAIAEQTLTPASSGRNPNINNVMTVDQLKQEHPETYNAIFNQGVQKEKSRVSAWMAYADADFKSVKEGISGDEGISEGKREELLIKSFSLTQVKNLEEDSAKALDTPESEGAKSEAEAEIEKFNAQLDEQLKTL